MQEIVQKITHALWGTLLSKERQFRETIQTIIQLQPKNLALYRLALQQRTTKGMLDSNERLEFLGDAVLSLIVGEYLFKKYPFKEEGFLTEVRSRIVNRSSLGDLAQKMGIDTLLQQYQRISLNQESKLIYGNALEALIGAVYLDHGYLLCRDFVLNQLLHLHMDLAVLAQRDTNYKSQLITWANRNQKGIHFTIVNTSYVGKLRRFTAQVTIASQVLGEGYGASKKQAEQQAALVALAKLTPIDT